MMSEQSIKVNIVGRVYPIKVNPEEEIAVRDAESKIKSNIEKLQSKYAITDKQDLLAMVALQLIVAKDLNSNQDLMKNLKELDQLLNESLTQ